MSWNPRAMHLLALAGAFAMLGAAPAYGSAINAGSTSGVFSQPVLAGSAILLNNSLLFLDNSSSAVYSGFGTNAIDWGSWSGPVPPGVLGHSSLTFTGATFTDVRLGVPFRLGSIEYYNGTSGSPTLIFGATLSISATRAGGLGLPITPWVEHLSLIGTQNGHPDPRLDADFVHFPSLGISFNVLEGKRATADVMGMIVGDPQLVITGLVPTSPNGFIGAGLADYTPEPSTPALAGLGLIGLWCMGVRRARGVRRFRSR